MKTATERAEQLRNELGNGLRYDQCLTNGKTLIEAVIADIQDEAFRAGLTEAAKIADNYVSAFPANSEAQNICGIIRDDIVASSKVGITEPPF